MSPTTQRFLRRTATLRERVLRRARAALELPDRSAELDELRGQVHDMNVGLNTLIGSLRGELHRDVDRLRGETDAARADLRHELSELRQQVDRVAARLEAPASEPQP